MSKYNSDLDYLTLGCDIFENDLNEIISEADAIINSNDVNSDTLARAHLKKGQCLQKLNKFAESKESLNLALQLHPDMPEVLVRIGNVISKIEHNFDVAIAIFNKALERNPWYAYGFAMVGNCFFSNKRLGDAIKFYTYAISCKIDYADAYNNRGAVYLYNGEVKKAIDDCIRAINIKQNYVEAYLNLCACYSKNIEYDRALAILKQAEQISPNNPDIFFTYGVVFYEGINDCDEAILYYTKVISLIPNHYNALFNRGAAYLTIKEFDKSISDSEKVLQLNPNSLDAFYNIGEAYWGKGEFSHAIDNYIKVFKLYNNPSENHLDVPDSKYTDLTSFLVNKLLKNAPEFFWDLPIDYLANIPNIFLSIIMKFRSSKLNTDVHKSLINAVYAIWSKCRFDYYNKNNGDKTLLYQYTSLSVLEKMRSIKRFRLLPASYLNDPDEGKVLINYLTQYYKNINNETMLNIIKSLSDTIKKAVYVRSFTSQEDTLIMWNSSYGNNGNGVAIGIPIEKVNKGHGIYVAYKGLGYIMRPVNNSSHVDTFELKRKNTENWNNGVDNNNANLMPLWKIGLYKIMYLDKNNLVEELKNIVDALSQFRKDDFTSIFLSLLDELFTTINHLIKDSAWEHENEYRLVFIETMGDEKQYINISNKNGECDGLYLETEPVLFQDSDDRVFFGPRVSDLTFKKYYDAFKLSGLPNKGSLDDMFKKSERHYRE